MQHVGRNNGKRKREKNYIVLRYGRGTGERRGEREGGRKGQRGGRKKERGKQKERKRRWKDRMQTRQKTNNADIHVNNISFCNVNKSSCKKNLINSCEDISTAMHRKTINESKQCKSCRNNSNANVNNKNGIWIMRTRLKIIITEMSKIVHNWNGN